MMEYKMLQEGEAIVEDEIDAFMCPLTYEIMESPTFSPCSKRTFEGEAIRRWVTAHGTDPISRDQLTVEQLKPNIALKEAIEVWKVQNKNWKDQLLHFKNKERQLKTELSEQQELLQKTTQEMQSLHLYNRQKTEALEEATRNESKLKSEITNLEREKARNEELLRRMQEQHTISGNQNDSEIKATKEKNRNLEERISQLQDQFSESQAKKDEELDKLKKETQTNKNKLKQMVDQVGYYKGRNDITQIRKGNQPFKRGQKYTVPSSYKDEKKELAESMLLAFENNNFAKAGTIVDKLIRTNPDDSFLRKVSGTIKIKLGNESNDTDFYDLAIEEFSRGATLDPKDDEMIRQWGWTYYRKDQNDRGKGYIDCAIEKYLKAQRINPSNIEINNSLGMAYRSKKMISEAKRYFKMGIDEGNDEAAVHLGDILKHEGDHEGAKREYERAVTLKSSSYNYKKLALLYESRGNATKDKAYFLKAIENYDNAIRCNTQEFHAYRQKGYCLTRMGTNKYAEAMVCYKKALEIAPTDEQTKKNMKWLQERLESASSPETSKEKSSSGKVEISPVHNKSTSRGRPRGKGRR